MDLPRLYAPTRIKFWSLRNGIGGGYGVIFDVDTEVECIAARVRCDEGWKWQLKSSNDDYFYETDQLSLDEIGMDLEYVTLSKYGYFR